MTVRRPNPDLQRIAVPVITGTQCKDRMKDLAAELARGEPDEPVSVFWIANGAMFFAADLIREMGFRKRNLLVEQVRGRSYDGTTSGPLRHDTDGIDFDRHRGRRIYVLDDVLDTGQTLHVVCGTIRRHLPGAQVLPVAFVVKDGCQKFEVSLHAHGFVVHGNPWLIGYGMDDDGFHRAEPGIWAKVIGGRPRRAGEVPVSAGGQPLQQWAAWRSHRKAAAGGGTRPGAARPGDAGEV